MECFTCECCYYKTKSSYDFRKHQLTDKHLARVGKKKCYVCHQIKDIKELGEWGTAVVYQCKACIQLFNEGRCKCLFCGAVVPNTEYETKGRCIDCKLLETGEGKVIKCDCGGSYKDVRSARERHFMSIKHVRHFGDELHK